MFPFVQAHNWSIEAVQQLTPNTCKRVTVETLSQAAKACVMKRELRLAEALIRLAVYTAAETFGTFHPKYAEALTEYGYYLLNSDSTRDSVVVYKVRHDFGHLFLKLPRVTDVSCPGRALPQAQSAGHAAIFCCNFFIVRCRGPCPVCSPT